MLGICARRTLLTPSRNSALCIPLRRKPPLRKASKEPGHGELPQNAVGETDPKEHEEVDNWDPHVEHFGPGDLVDE